MFNVNITITNENGETLFSANKPTVDMAIEELGRFEKHIQDLEVLHG